MLTAKKSTWLKWNVSVDIIVKGWIFSFISLTQILFTDVSRTKIAFLHRFRPTLRGIPPSALRPLLFLPVTLWDQVTFTDQSPKGRKEFLGKPRTFHSLAEMARENPFSRLALGVHFRMDCEMGLRLGKEVAGNCNASGIQACYPFIPIPVI